jgi:sigma-E factor negative regulatory protein RseB
MHDIFSLKQRPISAIASLFSFLLVLCVSTFPVHATESDTLTVQPLPNKAVTDIIEEPLASTVTMDADELLSKMSEATNALNYQSTLIVYRPGYEPIPYLWKHGIKDGQSVELLSELNGPNARIVRFGNQVSFLNPDMPAHSLQQSHIHGPFAHNLIRNPELISEAYEVILVGKSRSAGNEAWQLRIVSRDNSRYHYTLWMDAQSHLPLKLNTLNVKGELIEQVQATNLQISETLDTDFAQLKQDDMPQIMHLNPPKAFSLNWAISRLPVGMKKVKRDIHRLSITDDVVEYVLLSDGMVDVSVYLQKASFAQPEDVLFTKDAVTFLSRVNDALQVSVIGKIPPATAQRILQMIESVDAPVPSPSATNANP